MKFTKEQFDEIGPWHFSDLCFDSKNQDVMLKIFNLLPTYLQGKAVSWGCDDSVFRDEVFEYIIKNQFDMKPIEYMEGSEYFELFLEKGTFQNISFEKLEKALLPRKVSFDVETEGFDNPTFLYEGIVDRLKHQGGLMSGELGVIYVPSGVGKTMIHDKLEKKRITPKQILREYIKERFPIGCEIQDSTCSESYIIKKNSVFEIHPWTSDDYNPDYIPSDSDDYIVDFLVRNPGKNTRLHSIHSSTLGTAKQYLNLI